MLPLEESFENFRVRDYLQYLSKYFGQDGAKVEHHIEDIIKLTGLDPESNHPISDLMQSSRRRLSYARALVHHPKVLFIDWVEKGSTWEFELIQGLKSQADCLVLASNEFESKILSTDEVAVIESGSILVRGAEQTLIEQTIAPWMLQVQWPASEISYYSEKLRPLGYRLLKLDGSYCIPLQDKSEFLKIQSVVAFDQAVFRPSNMLDLRHFLIGDFV